MSVTLSLYEADLVPGLVLWIQSLAFQWALGKALTDMGNPVSF